MMNARIEFRNRRQQITDGSKFTVVTETNAGELGTFTTRAVFTWHTHINPFICKSWSDFWELIERIEMIPTPAAGYSIPWDEN